MKPFYCRQGSKRKYAEALESLFPPHQTYVEAFLGGGAVFWSKSPSHKEVINDFDSVLIKDYRNLVSAPSDPSSFPVLSSERSQNAFLANPPKTKSAKVVEALLRRCNGFGGTYLETDGVYKTTTHERKFEHIGEYKDRLKGVTILNESYDKVFRKYDSNETFFFLDPPYEMSKGLDYAKGSESFDFEALERACARLRGKFLITINDSPYIRGIFKDFHIYPYVVEGHHSKESSIGAKDRPELLISNYTLPSAWKHEMTV
jgi:DNA adenine methylase